MSHTHTQEPWRVWIEKEPSSGRITVLEICETQERGRHSSIASIAKHWPEAEDNARRIVACVNACAGISTESLEVGNYPVDCTPLVLRIEGLEQQRDELQQKCDTLLEALKFYANPEVYKPDSIGRMQDITYKANAVITSIESPTQEKAA